MLTVDMVLFYVPNADTSRFYEKGSCRWWWVDEAARARERERHTRQLAIDVMIDIPYPRSRLAFASAAAGFGCAPATNHPSSFFVLL